MDKIRLYIGLSIVAAVCAASPGCERSNTPIPGKEPSIQVGDTVYAYTSLKPVELLDLLISTKDRIVSGDDSPPGWISPIDAAALADRLDDETESPALKPASSSIIVRPRPAGVVAADMLGGFASDRFPRMAPFWPRERARKWWQSREARAEGHFLDNLMLFEVGSFENMPEGFVITDSALLRFVPHRLEQLTKHFQTDAGLKDLLGRLDRAEEVLAAYTLLNELYPNKRLDLLAGEIDMPDDETHQYPVRQTATGGIQVLDSAQFGRLVRDYWEKERGL